MTGKERRKIVRLYERGIPFPYIVKAMGAPYKRIAAVLGQHENVKRQRDIQSIRSIVTESDPEAYMRRRGVDYSEAA